MPFVTLATYTTPFEAEIVKGRLEAEGFTVVLGDTEVVTNNWMYSQAIGGVKLRVPEAEVEEARRVLAEPVETEDAESVPEAEQLAWRAFQAAAVGLALPPLHLYAVYLLVKYLGVAEDETPKTRRRVLWAVVMLLPYAALIGAVVWLS
ncbi:MAG: DUF2007 domain-containing protein [Bacteroidota bacterium]